MPLVKSKKQIFTYALPKKKIQRIEGCILQDPISLRKTSYSKIISVCTHTYLQVNN